VLAGYLLDCVRAGSEEGVGEIGDDEADEFGALAFKESRGLILAIAELDDRGLHLLTGSGPDGGVIVDYARYGHKAYARELGDVSDCGSARLALRHRNQHNRRAAEGRVSEGEFVRASSYGHLAKGLAIAYPSFNDSSECYGAKIECLKDLACNCDAGLASQGQIWDVLLAFTNYIWTGRRIA